MRSITFLVSCAVFSVALAIPLDTLFPGQVPETTTEAIETSTTTTEKAKTVSNSEKRRLYEAALKRCTENGDQMPFYNATQQKYLCYNLLQQGPCKNGEWVTLDAKLAKIGVYFARCFPQKCKNTQDNELIETKNGCEPIYNDANCPPGEELKANPFGKGKFEFSRGKLKNFPLCKFARKF